MLLWAFRSKQYHVIPVVLGLSPLEQNVSVKVQARVVNLAQWQALVRIVFD